MIQLGSKYDLEKETTARQLKSDLGAGMRDGCTVKRFYFFELHRFLVCARFLMLRKRFRRMRPFLLRTCGF